MKKLFIALFVVSLSMFSSSSFAIADDYYTLPTLEETYKDRNLAAERFHRVMRAEAKSDPHRIIRDYPEVFDINIDGKTRECYYEGKNII